MKHFSVVGLIMALLSVVSCTEDLFTDEVPYQGLQATISAYETDMPTRVSFSPDFAAFTWSNGDKIGIYQQTSTSDNSAVFSIREGGSNSGTFSNSSFILKPSTSYYAFYPYQVDGTVSNYPVKFTGQVQNENGSTAHIGKTNYMRATVNTDNNGEAKIQFVNVAAILQVVMDIAASDTYSAMVISSNNRAFITEGSVNMTDGTITPTVTSQKMSLSLGNGLALKKGEQLVANLLIAPSDMSNSILTVTLNGTQGTNQTISATGKLMKAGKGYRLVNEAVNLGGINEFLFFKALDSNSSIKYVNEFGNNPNMMYSTDKKTWRNWYAYQNLTLNKDEVVFIKGSNANGLSSYSKFTQFVTTGSLAAGGNVMSLLYADSFENKNAIPSESCFYRLFSGTGITTAPELPAINLTERCYESMFEGCTRLTEAPQLPATSMKSWCYSSLFEGCTSLTKATELPASSLAEGCYGSMFKGCTRLSTVPSLPATTIANLCYYSMFQDCTSLAVAPALPAKTLADGCYSHMFYHCTNLSTAPVLPATVIKPTAYYCMFENCTKLIKAPALPATTLAEWCYYSMFQGCTSLTAVPQLPANTLSDNCYYSMFQGCTNLATAPQLPARALAESCYYSMFQGCRSLITAPSLPATDLKPDCYANMFRYCNNLATAPELPASTLAQGCYAHLFEGCTKISSVKVAFTAITYNYWLEKWLSGTSATGTLYKKEAATWNDDLVNLPAGWHTACY